MAGSIIVAGSAPSVREDVKDAKRPNAPIMAVNHTIRALPEAEFCFCAHFDLVQWREFAGNRPIMARRPGPNEQKTTGPTSKYPEIDKWVDTPATSAGSGINAALAAKVLGFDEIILAGIGLDWTEGYVDNLVTDVFFPARQRQIATKRHQAGLRAAIEKGIDFSGIVSMRGYTREVFGAPVK